jgi:hypothetical protein
MKPLVALLLQLQKRIEPQWDATAISEALHSATKQVGQTHLRISVLSKIVVVCSFTRVSLSYSAFFPKVYCPMRTLRMIFAQWNYCRCDMGQLMVAIQTSDV